MQEQKIAARVGRPWKTWRNREAKSGEWTKSSTSQQRGAHTVLSKKQIFSSEQQSHEGISREAKLFTKTNGSKKWIDLPGL